MNTENNIHLIKTLLNNTSSQLSPVTLEKLRAARARALDRQRTRTSPVLAWISTHGNINHAYQHSKTKNLAIALLMLASLYAGMSYWQSHDMEHEISEVDLAILTDDMPIHVYVD